MSYNFNEEDKVKWSELSPSLQAKFNFANVLKGGGEGATYRQLQGARILLSRYAPTAPINNEDLWVDEKYRVARAYTESNWEFTRAAWASNGFTPSSPQENTYTVPSVTSQSVEYETKTISNAIKYYEVPNTNSATLTYNTSCSEYNSTYKSFEIYGYNIILTIKARTQNPLYDHQFSLGNLLYTIDDIPGVSGVDQYDDVTLKFYTNTTTCAAHTLKMIFETTTYSLRKQAANLAITPVDKDSVTSPYSEGTDFQSTTSYPYYFLIAKALKNGKKYTDSDFVSTVERGTIGTSDPTFYKLLNTVTFTIDITYTGIK